MITILLCELVTRITFPPLRILKTCFSTVSDQRIFTLVPNSKIIFYGVHDWLKVPVLWQVNSQGLRENRLIPHTKTAGKYRIATYGDSEVFGWSVNSEDTFQSQMEKSQPTFEVINFGVPGYNINNILEHIKLTADTYHPDGSIPILLVKSNIDFL